MAQRLLVQTCLFVALGQLAGASSQRLEDSAALVQTVARVKDEIVEQEQEQEQRPHIRPLRELLTEAGQKWAAKSEVAGKKWFERQEEKMAHVDDMIREKIHSLSEPPSPPQEQTSEEDEEEHAPEQTEQESPRQVLSGMSEEAKTAKYGYPITLVVTDPLERRLHVKFRKHTKLHALFNSLCKRSRLQLDAVSFVSGSRLLQANETAASAGLDDGDVIELHSQDLERRQEKKKLAEKAAARHAQVLAEKEEALREELLHKSAAMAAAREKLLADLAAVRANRTQLNKTKVKVLSKREKRELRRIKRARAVKAGHMVDLKFVDAKGKEVVMAFKRENAFGPLQTLVCKRLGLKEAETGFYWFNELRDMPILANATVHSLHLPNHAVIKVLPLSKPVQ